MAEDAKIMEFTIRKMCSRERAKGVAGQLFAEDIRRMTHGSNQSPQFKSGIKWGYPGSPKNPLV